MLEMKYREFLLGNYFLVFSGGGDKTITGPRGAARRLNTRLGVNAHGRGPRHRGGNRAMRGRQCANIFSANFRGRISAGGSALLEAGRCQMRVSNAPPTGGLSEKPLI
jgi:hypothetical protein